MLAPARAAAFTVLVALGLALGLGVSGCADRACFRWQNSQGVCPTQQQATKFFGACSNIETVDGPPSFVDGDLCCYDVTRSLSGLPCEPLGSGGAGGRSSSPSHVSSHSSSGSQGTGGTPGTGGFTNTGGSTFGSGGSGGAPPCETLPCGFAGVGEPLGGCLACAQVELCGNEADACNADMDCVAFEMCIDACSIMDPVCLQGCVDTIPQGAALFGDYIDCEVCLSCPATCSGNPVENLTNCGGTGTSTP